MPTYRTGSVHVRVPATSANLGPAFDCAGLALQLYDDVLVRVADAGLTVDVTGEEADRLPRDGRHLVVASLRAAFDRLGGQPRGLALRCTNRIPQARGLGSSSAAIVAAVLAARALVAAGEQLLDDDGCLALASELEGHPDNVAACLRGGLTLAWTGDSGPRALRLDAAATLAPVVFVPPGRVPTRQVRALLPASVPHADAAASAGRAALLAHAVSCDTSLLLAATEDRLHQRYRAPAMPGSAALVAALRADGVPAVVSGAGPSVLALTTGPEREPVAGRAPHGWTVLPLDVAPAGATVVSPS